MRGNDRTQSWHSTSARPGGPRVVDGGGGEAPEVVAGRAKSPIAFPMECETVKLDSAVMPGKLSHLDPVHQCCLDPVDPRSTRSNNGPVSQYGLLLNVLGVICLLSASGCAQSGHFCF
jgi:hypothetical protein